MPKASCYVKAFVVGYWCLFTTNVGELVFGLSSAAAAARRRLRPPAAPAPAHASPANTTPCSTDRHRDTRQHGSLCLSLADAPESILWNRDPPDLEGEVQQ